MICERSIKGNVVRPSYLTLNGSIVMLCSVVSSATIFIFNHRTPTAATVPQGPASHWVF